MDKPAEGLHDSIARNEQTTTADTGGLPSGTCASSLLKYSAGATFLAGPTIEHIARRKTGKPHEQKVHLFPCCAVDAQDARPSGVFGCSAQQQVERLAPALARCRAAVVETAAEGTLHARSLGEATVLLRTRTHVGNQVGDWYRGCIRTLLQCTMYHRRRPCTRCHQLRWRRCRTWKITGRSPLARTPINNCAQCVELHAEQRHCINVNTLL